MFTPLPEHGRNISLASLTPTSPKKVPRKFEDALKLWKEKTDVSLFPSSTELDSSQQILVLASVAAKRGFSLAFVTDKAPSGSPPDVFVGERNAKAHRLSVHTDSVIESMAGHVFKKYDHLLGPGDDLQRNFLAQFLKESPSLFILLFRATVILFFSILRAYRWADLINLSEVFNRAWERQSDETLWEIFARKLVPSFRGRAAEKFLRAFSSSPSDPTIDYLWEFFKKEAIQRRLTAQSEASVYAIVDYFIDLGFLNVQRR